MAIIDINVAGDLAVPVLTPENPEVALDVSLRIEDTSRYGGGWVTPEDPGKDRQSLTPFVNVVFPGRRVEYLSRTTGLALRNRYGDDQRLDQPTSMLFQAVHLCFANHFPLALRPEVLWHQILSEVATCVKMNPEAYRHLFTGQLPGEQKLEIHITANHLVKGNGNNDWASVLGKFDDALSGIVPPTTREAILVPLSTGSVESRTANIIAFMAAASPFFDYHTHTLCGIPRIRLLGKKDDWIRLAQQARQLAQMFETHLGRYFQYLIPVLDKLASEVDAKHPDEHFWSSIYKFESHSGTDLFNGWISTFVNYINEAGYKRNPQTGVASVEGALVQKPDNAFAWDRCGSGWGMKGLSLGSVPTQIATAPFTWHYYNEKLDMVYFAGPLGIENRAGFVTPELGFGVIEQ